MADFWLVTYKGFGLVLTDDEFIEFADRVKYDGVEYEAQPLRRAGDNSAHEPSHE